MYFSIEVLSATRPKSLADLIAAPGVPINGNLDPKDIMLFQELLTTFSALFKTPLFSYTSSNSFADLATSSSISLFCCSFLLY